MDHFTDICPDKLKSSIHTIRTVIHVLQIIIIIVQYPTIRTVILQIIIIIVQYPTIRTVIHGSPQRVMVSGRTTPYWLVT